MKVSLMVTCLGDAFFPDVGLATVRLLRRLGVEVDFPQAQTCCGQPHFNSGYHDLARDLARHTITAFGGGRTVVTPSGSCAAMVKLEYPELLHGDLVWHARAEDLDDLLLLGLQASRQADAEQSLIQRTRRIGSTGVARAMRPDGPLVNLWPVRGAPHARRRPKVTWE